MFCKEPEIEFLTLWFPESDDYSHEDDPDDSPSLPEITARRRSSSEPPVDDEGARKISMLSKGEHFITC